jgi:site-specific DNA-methyltransferase (adenine-specific)
MLLDQGGATKGTRAVAEADYQLDEPDTRIYVGDCRQHLDRLPEKSVDLIFADPPFNWDVPYDEWDDSRPREEYLAFTHQWLDACLRVLANHGSFWINIPDDSAAEIVVHLKQRGMVLMNWCIWHFRFGQHRVGNFIVSKVHALYFVRDRDNRVWNASEILEPSDRAAIYDDPRTRKTRQPGKRVPLDVWYGPNWGRVQGNNRERRRNHQNQIPEVYLERVIRSCSNENQLVLDPFLGSGTTCTVARALGRQSIGIEYSSRNAASAFERIQAGPIRLGPRVPESNSFMTQRRLGTNGLSDPSGAVSLFDGTDPNPTRS